METDTSQNILKELQRNVLSLEMEISPAIITSLQQQVQECRQQWQDNLPTLMVLQAMTAVMNHIQALEAKSHDGVLTQLNNLLQVLETTINGETEKGRDDAVAALDEVLNWQQACLLACGDIPPTSQAQSTSDNETEISAVIAEELKQTTQLIRDEVTDICGTMAQQSPPMAEHAQISALIAEQVEALQSVFKDELDQLRVELQER
jgi:cysteinyl-tRNA synthetase